MYFINKATKMTKDRVLAYIEDYRINHLQRLLKNKRYYDTKNDNITNRTFADTTKPNNKIPTSWSKYITTLVSGYFMGKPITYFTPNDYMQELLTAYNTKDMSHNQSLAKDCSIYGLAAEILYINEIKQVAYERLEPTTVIPIYSADVEKQLLYVIRFWEITDILSSNQTTHIEVYSDEDVTTYTKDLTGTKIVGVLPNPFGKVPINIYYNNSDLTGDSEGVLQLIDGYDLAMSDTANFRQELQDSYLVFRNTNLEDKDIIDMKSRRVIAIEDAQDGMQSSVSWLNKDSNDSEQENYKNRLAEDIKKFSFVADIESAKSHTTATSAKIGLLGIEQVCVDKECEFRKSLLRRWELVSSIERKKGHNVSIQGLTMTFVRNIPIDLSLVGDTVSKIAPFVSSQTLLEQIPFVTDVAEELKRKQEENSLNAYDVDMFGGESDEEEV